MEVVRGDGCLQHHDRARPQMIVQRVTQRLGGDGAAQIEMRDLAGGVHAGIGAAGPDHLDVLAAELAHRLLERLLHGIPATLPLPAAKRPAVILERQLVAGHGVPSRAADRQVKAAQKRVRRHGLAAGALQPGQPERALAAGYRQAVVEHLAGGAAAGRELACEHEQALALDLGPAAGPGVERAQLPLQKGGRAASSPGAPRTCRSWARR